MGSHSAANSKKRKRSGEPNKLNGELDTSKPTAIFNPSNIGRGNTLSIAVPGSIIANAQTHDLKSNLCSTIARAATVFTVDEIIVFDDLGPHYHPPNQTGYHERQDQTSGYDGYKDPTNFLYHVLSYLETPPHLRKALFGFHENLRTAGALSSLDAPHHLKPGEWCQYREGVTISASGAEGKARKKRSGEASTTVDAGFPVQVPVDIPPNTRVTVKFPSAEPPAGFPSDSRHEPSPLHAEVVDPAAPREEVGYYWGYSVRLARSLSAVFTECEFEGGYDVSIGTSERGTALRDVLPLSTSGSDKVLESKLPGSYTRALVVLGGPAGLESAAEADADLKGKGINKHNVNELFDYWVNVLPDQGSRTIRTEEALWITLTGLRNWAVSGRI